LTTAWFAAAGALFCLRYLFFAADAVPSALCITFWRACSSPFCLGSTCYLLRGCRVYRTCAPSFAPCHFPHLELLARVLHVYALFLFSRVVTFFRGRTALRRGRTSPYSGSLSVSLCLPLSSFSVRYCRWTRVPDAPSHRTYRCAAVRAGVGAGAFSCISLRHSTRLLRSHVCIFAHIAYVACAVGLPAAWFDTCAWASRVAYRTCASRRTHRARVNIRRSCTLRRLLYSSTRFYAASHISPHRTRTAAAQALMTALISTAGGGGGILLKRTALEYRW